jgi:hypothetical protein
MGFVLGGGSVGIECFKRWPRQRIMPAVPEEQPPMLVIPDDTPAHPYPVAMEIAALAPKADVTVLPGERQKRSSPRRATRRANSSGRINP